MSNKEDIFCSLKTIALSAYSFGYQSGKKGRRHTDREKDLWITEKIFNDHISLFTDNEHLLKEYDRIKKEISDIKKYEDELNRMRDQLNSIKKQIDKNGNK